MDFLDGMIKELETALGEAPEGGASQSAAPPAPPAADVEGLKAQITSAGDKVRELKAAKADKAEVTAAVGALLELKKQYKAQTGEDFPAAGGKKDKKKKKKQPAEPKPDKRKGAAADPNQLHSPRSPCASQAC